MEPPVIIYCCKGAPYLYYVIWSIRSLRRFSHVPVEVIASTKGEAAFISRECPDVTCHAQYADAGDYPAFSYKPFALSRYLQQIGLRDRQRRVVICDADVLWLRDPAPLFERFGAKPWVHKITAINPRDYTVPPEQVPASNIGLRTIQAYARRAPVNRYPNFIINAGLFMLEGKAFGELMDNWMKKILLLPPEEMRMSEALMSLTYAELGWPPVSDREDIKYAGIERSDPAAPVAIDVGSFEYAPPRAAGVSSGYETAAHFYGDQRGALHRAAGVLALDPDCWRWQAQGRLWMTRLLSPPGAWLGPAMSKRRYQPAEAP